MPKLNNKNKLIEELQHKILLKKKYITGILRDDGDDEELRVIAQKLGKQYLRRHRYTKALLYLTENRYAYKRGSSYKRKGDYYKWLMLQNDKVFRRETRMPTKIAFENICKRVQNHACYAASDSGRKQRSVPFQVAVVLYRLGLSGGGSSLENVASHCGIGVGTVQTYTTRFFTAILAISKDWIIWPTEQEKKTIKEANEKRFGFPNCVGFVDGSLIELEFEPHWRGEEFYTRKANYAIQNLAICDDKRRIRYFSTGFFGSTHDSRVFNGTIGCTPEQYFSKGEYILADSAYASTSYMIPPYKKPANAELDSDKKAFNKMHSGTRIAIEHCFGMLKCRFGSLKKLRHQIHNEKVLVNVCQWIRVCVVLHNMLIEEPTDEHLLKKAKRLSLYEQSLDSMHETSDNNRNAPYDNENIDSLTGNQLRDSIAQYILERNKRI